MVLALVWYGMVLVLVLVLVCIPCPCNGIGIGMQWYGIGIGIGMLFMFDPNLILTCGPIFPSLLDDNGFDWCAKKNCHCCGTGSRGDHGQRMWMVYRY
jgi:hypothetical protein